MKFWDTDGPEGAFAGWLLRCGLRTETIGRVSLGLADLGAGFALRVTRGRSYAVVRITPALPFEAANAVNETRHIEDGTRNSAHNSKLGGLARAHGFDGGLYGDALQTHSAGYVDEWHVDAVGALDALVNTLRKVIAEQGLTAKRARANYSAAHTEKWVRECAPSLRSTGCVAEIVRENLHADDTLDASDPRIVALRAEFPDPSATPEATPDA